jgi:hypothetical protein
LGSLVVLIAAALLGSAIVLLGPTWAADGARDQACLNPGPWAWHGLESQGQVFDNGSHPSAFPQVARLDPSAPRLAAVRLKDPGASLARRRPKKDDGEIVVADFKAIVEVKGPS